jgi:hypothetical protein
VKLGDRTLEGFCLAPKFRVHVQLPYAEWHGSVRHLQSIEVCYGVNTRVVDFIYRGTQFVESVTLFHKGELAYGMAGKTKYPKTNPD